MTTIKEVAKLAKTSKSTVSRFINGYPVKEVTAQAIIEAIKKVDYHPNVNARRLVLNKTNIIGVILDNIANSYYSDMLSAIEHVAELNNYGCVYYSCMSSKKKEVEFLSLLHEGQVDGLILGTFSNRNEKDIALIHNSQLPVVIFGDNGGNSEITSVDIDNEEGIIEEVTYLYSLGHRRIAHLKGPDNMHGSCARVNGYKKALKKLGLPFDEKLMVSAGWNFESGNEAIKELIKNEKFTAVVCSNDYCAFGAIRGIIEMGLRVPEDISVTGFDDSELSKFVQPSITTIKQPFYDVGKKTALEVIDKISNASASNSRTILKPKLIVRESCSGIQRNGL